MSAGWTRVAIAAVLVPFAVAGVVLAVDGGSFTPWADTALTELVVRDVGSHSVLVGPYSRFGWNHPGPILFYLLAAPYRAVGASAGLDLGALAINAASAVGICLVVRRRGSGALVLWCVVGIGLLLGALGAEVLRDSWNPRITVLPFTLAVFCTWAVLRGSRWAVVAVVVIGSFVVQSHVGYAPAVLALLVVVSASIIRRWHAARDDEARRVMVVGSIVGGVLWLPPVVDQIVNERGNLREIGAYFLNHGGSHGIDDAARAVLVAVGEPVAWLVGAEVAWWPGAIVVAVLVVTLVLAVWHGHPDAKFLAALGALVVAVGVVSMSRVVGPIEDYLALWTVSVFLVAWVAAGALAHAEFTARKVSEAARRVLVLGMAVVAFGLGIDVTIAAANAGAPEAATSVTIGDLTRRVVREVPPGDDPIVVEIPDHDQWPYAAGVVLQLERAGYDVRVDPSERTLFGRRATPTERPRVVVTFEDGEVSVRRAP